MVRYFLLEMTVLGPVLSKGSEPGDPDLDAVTLRAPEGSLVINGKHIHGRCRHAALELAHLSGKRDLSEWVNRAFGPQATQKESERGEGGWSPRRSALSFEELRCSGLISRDRGSRDYRLKKDELTEAGKDQMLAVLERAGEHGESLRFSGKVRAVCESDKDAETHRANLLRALRWLTNIGGEVGVDYGRIQNVCLKPCRTPQGSEGAPLQDEIPNTIDLCLRFTEPFCLAKPQLDENIFRCLDYVPGSALAGSIRRALDDVEQNTLPDRPRFKTLLESFDLVRFRHAFPIGPCVIQRPIPTPLSWVSVGPKERPKFIDAALLEKPHLFKVDRLEYIPNFPPDWKGTEDPLAASATGWGSVETELRTYTEIDRVTGVARDERLYAYELVRPDRAAKGGGRESVVWHGAMDIADVPAGKRVPLIKELYALLDEAPLLFGKTDARATLSLNAQPEGLDPEPIPHNHTTDYWIVTLATDALLLDLEELTGEGQTELDSAYKAVWNEIGKRALENIQKCDPKQCNSPIALSHYFSREKLVGGNYLYHRFFGSNTDYSPYLITGAGSVFVLESHPGDREQIQTLFSDPSRGLLRTGLPLRQWAQKKFRRHDRNGQNHGGEYWENCPFIPQNGYGEILVNHPAQVERLHKSMGVEATPVQTVVWQ